MSYNRDYGGDHQPLTHTLYVHVSRVQDMSTDPRLLLRVNHEPLLAHHDFATISQSQSARDVGIVEVSGQKDTVLYVYPD